MTEDWKQVAEKGVFDAVFSIPEKEISFHVLSVKDWFCLVSVPKVLLRCNALTGWKIKVDDTPTAYNATENATYTAPYSEHNKGSHIVGISGTHSFEP
jgi:hypothetical protein